MNDWIPVLVAAVSTTGAVVVALIQFGRKNSAEHAQTMATMRRVEDGVGRVEVALNEHLGWHKGAGDVLNPR